jgi:serine/threonine protein kinase
MTELLNNRYRILQTLGSGGFGKTFLAEDTHMPSRRRCVVKQLKPITTDPALHQLIQERFQREAANLEKLAQYSDQIPALYAYFSEANEFYLVQEWVKGKNLLQKLREDGKFSESEVTKLLISILLVLDYIHWNRIIHRDIKLDNIMLRDSDGKPVLIDFGAVKEAAATVIDSHNSPISTILIGTPGFMPTEQAAGRPVFASDLYSLAVTAICLLTGKLPSELTDPNSGNLEWKSHVPNISRAMADILDKATQPHVRDRYMNTREMLDDLFGGRDQTYIRDAAHDALLSTALDESEDKQQAGTHSVNPVNTLLKEAAPLLPQQVPPVPTASPPAHFNPAHITILGILHIGFGTIFLLAMLLSFDEMFSSGNRRDTSATFIAILTFCLQVPLVIGIIGGVGLLKRQTWARPLIMVAGCASLFIAPIGTFLGVYTIWVLRRLDTARQSIPGAGRFAWYDYVSVSLLTVVLSFLAAAAYTSSIIPVSTAMLALLMALPFIYIRVRETRRNKRKQQ